MKTLQEVMTTPVLSIEPDKSVSHALGIMEQKTLSALIVAKDKKPLGIFTERALIQIRVGGEIDYSSPIHQVMSSPPLTAPVDMDYREAYQLLLQHRFRHLVVTDQDGYLVGIVTGTDFLSHLGLEYFMEFKNVGQVMIRDVVTLKASLPAFTAMKLMNDRRISSLVIEDNGYPKGIITERDLLRLIRAKIDLETVPLQDVMSKPVQTVFSDVSSHEAAKIFMSNKLRRLVVTNSSGRCVGIITETDMVKGLRTSYTDHLKGVIQQKDRQLKKVKRQMEERSILDSMLQSVGDMAITIMDPELEIIIHNHAAEDLHDCAADTLIGSSAEILYKNRNNLKQFKKAVAVANKEGRHEFVMKQYKVGTPRYLATTVFCIRDQEENKTGFGLIARDITEQKKGVLELEQKKKEAEDANIALKVMLDQHTRTRESVEEQISIKLQELVNPYLDLLQQSGVNEKQSETISIIAAHIDSITHQFTPKARKIMLKLSPRETLIADLVRQGKTSKDISEILHVSLRTVETYRNNLRKKLGINKKKIGLRTYLTTDFRYQK
ncbi:MAG TPA: CBS domain-containing protein [Desulfobacterales bacterium]|nr:CBS domain-containing protein [Desulfobacterales bacterium]HIP39169.1 CBS domain-containing protein [Desulfocapsa sulfexigens]